MPGGITNQNYRLETERGFLVARVCKELPLLGIDRRNEALCHRLAAHLGLAPELVHQEPGLLVSRFVAGQTLSAVDLVDSRLIGRLGAALRQLHDGWDVVTGQVLYFCPFQAIRTYARSAVDLGAKLPREIDELVEESRRLAHGTGPFRPVLCHNDLLPANLIDDGDRFWLLDWEYAGMGNPLFDLASISANAGFTPEQELVLLEAYRGRIHPADLRELHVLKAASSLREALWAVIQTVTSELPFDYHAYAAKNFEAYRQARRANSI